MASEIQAKKGEVNMEYRIGEIFRRDGKTYQCVEDIGLPTCRGCAFYEMFSSCRGANIGDCFPTSRSDGKNVRYVEVTQSAPGMLFRASDGNTYQVVSLNGHACNCGPLDCIQIDRESFGELQKCHWVLAEEGSGDVVNHPKHYAGYPATIECIDVTRHLPFALGNAVKYIWRAGKKGGLEQGIEDLRKARWYLEDWINMEFDPAIRLGRARIVFNLLSDSAFQPAIRHTVISRILEADVEAALEGISVWMNRLEKGGGTDENH